mmetsp:Transcript_5457/g.9618  ORF Transcript_5457/g.9618 Transcript_5457/m.9618 type:complete len:314 (-) Transcript_5457:132-1073(-)
MEINNMVMEARALLDGENPLMILVVLAAAALAGFFYLLGVKPNPSLDPVEFQTFPLVRKEIISHDTRKFTFGLPKSTMKLGLPVGQHISLRFTDTDGKNHQRSYTPVTGDETPGTVSFVIKVYKAGVHPKFPLGGKMSQHLDSLDIGDMQEMRGPKGHLTLLKKGKFTISRVRKPLEHRDAKHFGMIAGGTGITPMLQVIQAIFRDTSDKTTTVSLLYANQSEDDILVRDELERYAKEYPDRFNLHYTVDRAPSDGSWKYSTGFISAEMIREHLPAASPDTQIFMCGPPLMLKFACIPALTELGFKENQHFSF